MVKSLGWFDRWRRLPEPVSSRVKVARLIVDAFNEVDGISVGEPEEFIGPLGGEGVKIDCIIVGSQESGPRMVSINVYGK